jgi:serine/threonine protein phosphatase PrpC
MLNRNDGVLADVVPGRSVAPRSCASRTAATASQPKTKPDRPLIRLEFDDGTAVVVRGRGLIGRDPAPASGERVEHLLTLADDTLSVSRTHLEFGIGESGLWIRDRSSTNGSAIEMEGRRIPIEPGLRVPAPAGCTIHLGARRVRVRTGQGHVVMDAATIDWGAATHAGAVHERRHEDNQDAYFTGPPVFVVADGIGGHCAGDVASREAVDALLPLVGQVQVTGAMLTACLSDARARIGRIAIDGGRPPGSTLSGVIATRVDGVPSWLVVNIGDSRTYRLDSDALRQLSVDHTVVQELIDRGAIPPSAASSHPARNLLTRALLAGAEHPADISVLPMRTGDRILVCSDGLTGDLDDGFIAAVLRTTSDPQIAAKSLIRAAIDEGGHDDLTALVVDVLAIRHGTSQSQTPRPGIPVRQR